MLQKHDYRMALVSRSGPHGHGRSESEQFSISTGAVLLPFSWKELVLGIRESLRESSPVAESRVASFGDVHVNIMQMEVKRSSSGLVTLTRQEFKTLACFVSNPGRVLSREELLNEAWGYHNYPTTRTVDNHVLKLRQKLEKDPAHPVHFQTVHSIGYKFVP
jgi:DNA-binding response OmpR family regulator